ncbi:hypothetical protein [Arenibaculum sp.]|uniref:hypothetical protein n=1 Tax=Arenibaculum sp. TaxID=2865862 RepID=UPI002E13EDF3|nr:hypothetical protein [Arenibaculum sp.]
MAGGILSSRRARRCRPRSIQIVPSCGLTLPAISTKLSRETSGDGTSSPVRDGDVISGDH